MAKILVVDDDEALRDLLKQYLEIDGHAVDTAENGAQAVAKLRAARFELVTLDVEMPGMNGMEILKVMRADPAMKSIPVLMCTAHNMMEALDAAYQEGANGYITKPFERDALRRSVAKALPKTHRDEGVSGF